MPVESAARHAVRVIGATQDIQVLVVDDDYEMRDALQEVLVGEGFGVELACDGVEALESLEQHSADALVCDLDMPRMNGLGLVHALRKRGANCVVVILSGRFDLLATTGDLGQVYAIAKPVEPERLVKVIREAVEGRS